MPNERPTAGAEHTRSQPRTIVRRIARLFHDVRHSGAAFPIDLSTVLYFNATSMEIAYCRRTLRDRKTGGKENKRSGYTERRTPVEEVAAASGIGHGVFGGAGVA